MLYFIERKIKHFVWLIVYIEIFLNSLIIRAVPFYFFLIKEIVFSHRIRRRFKESDRYDPDGLESLNFDLIDEIFNSVVERLGIELSAEESHSEKLREAVRTKKEFTIPGLSEETGIDPYSVYAFISNPINSILENFEVKKKQKHSGRGGPMNVYIKKN